MKHIIIDYLNLVCVLYLTKFHIKYLYQKDILIIVWSSMAKAGIRRVYHSSPVLQLFNPTYHLEFDLRRSLYLVNARSTVKYTHGRLFPYDIENNVLLIVSFRDQYSY